MTAFDFATGTLRLEPVKYWIETDEVVSWFGLRRRTRYWVHSEFMRLGPFDDQNEALAAMHGIQSA